MKLWIGDNLEAVSREAARRFALAAEATVRRDGRFAVALAGGSTPRRLYELLAGGEAAPAVDWRHTHVFFSDERCVPPDHPDSNYRMARKTLLDHVPVAGVHRARGEDNPAAAAAAYAAELRETLGLEPALDLLLLGMGADGHTASLFPGHPALAERQEPAVAVWADHLQMWRVSLTLPVLNQARQVLVLVSGAGKAAALRRVLREPAEGLPIQQVAPASGDLTFLVDRAAAAELSEAEE